MVVIPAPRRRLAALSSSPVQQRYRELLRSRPLQDQTPPESPDLSTEFQARDSSAQDRPDAPAGRGWARGDQVSQRAGSLFGGGVSRSPELFVEGSSTSATRGGEGSGLGQVTGPDEIGQLVVDMGPGSHTIRGD
jgi:hypothetical protein